MDNIVTDEKLKQCIERVICNINKNIYTWNENVKANPKYKSITFQEIKSLFNNWFIRELKPLIGYRECSNILSGGAITMDVKDDAVTKVSLKNPIYYKKGIYYSRIETILSKINYESLKYNPSDYVQDKEDHQIKDVAFFSLESLKFDYSIK